MANAEDLNRLTSCSLVLLSHVFLSIGNSKESMNMVTPAMQLASKIPDIHVQLWGSAILKDLHRMSKDAVHEKEAYANHVKYSENLIADQLKCVQSIHHSLIDWLSGPPPATGLAAITATATNNTDTNNQILATNQQIRLQPQPQAQPIPTTAAINTSTHALQHLSQQQVPVITNPTHNIPSQIVHQSLPQLPIASTSAQQQHQMLPPQQQQPQTQHQQVIIQHSLPQHQVIMNQPQQTVQYIHQPIGPQVQQQQFGQYY